MSKTIVVTATEEGEIVGFKPTPRVIHFRGVPYAAPPFGSLRFKAPQPHEPWDGPRDASVTGPTPPQEEAAFRGPRFNYRGAVFPRWVRGVDILNLNIWTPGLDGSLPVMVWIHGGAFSHGNGALPIYDGVRFAERDVVLVTINYRLGMEGFLKLEGGNSNVGIRDQIAALRWIRRNIARFGGDPENVTIFGESAGAVSVALLMASPLTHGLFHKAISQSGIGPYLSSEAEAESTASKFADFVESSPTTEALGTLSQEQMLKASVRYAASQPTGFAASEGPLMVGPYADGEVLPVGIESDLARFYSRVPSIWGFNSDEANLFLVPNGAVDAITEDQLFGRVSAIHSDPSQVVAHYSAQLSDGAIPGEILSRIETWYTFGRNTVAAAEAMASVGAPTWLYEFTWRSPQLGGRIGAAHMMEIPFVFDNLAHPNIPAMVGDDPPRELADAMQGSWVEFARSSEPGWPAYTGGGGRGQVRLFDEASADVSGRYVQELELWAGRAAHSRA